MTGLCTCNKFKIVSPLRSTSTFRWMCEGCKAKSRLLKRKENDDHNRRLRVLREVMPTFSIVDTTVIFVERKRRG